MDFAFSYIHIFIQHLIAAWPLLGMMILVIVLLGMLVGMIEAWSRFDAVYWAFITATTVGYGDIRPKKPVSRVLSILIAFIGVIFTGLLVALAINAATLAFSAVEASQKTGVAPPLSY